MAGSLEDHNSALEVVHNLLEALDLVVVGILIEKHMGPACLVRKTANALRANWHLHMGLYQQHMEHTNIGVLVVQQQLECMSPHENVVANLQY